MTPSQPGSDRTAPPPARPGGRAELLPRIVSSVVMGAAALGTAVAGGPLFDLFWWLAAVAFAALIAAAIVHTFNYDRDFHIPVEDVNANEDARTRALAAAGV